MSPLAQDPGDAKQHRRALFSRSVSPRLKSFRRFFNSAVQEYNTGIEQFPAALFASAFGFHHRTFFDLGESRPQLEQAPSVKF